MFTSRTRLCLLTILGALAAAASTAPGASAATQRYASPTGSGTACSSAGPCSITQAITGAINGDEVIVAPGDYPVTGTLSATGVTIHGVAGEPRPRLLFSGVNGADLDLNSTTLRYVEVDQTPGQYGDALAVHNSFVDQVIARGSALPDSETVWSRNTTIRNSIIVAPGPSGTAILTYQNGGFVSGTYRNVTAIASESGGVAILTSSSGATGSASVLARNVIARGGPGGASLVASTDSAASAKVTVDHSNWLGGSTSGSNASIVDAGSNQSALPAFVNAAAGDYHEAAGSPTIDAGLSEFLDGDFDVQGNPREIGTIDIGADEFVVAPEATTGPAAAVTEQSATLTGSVNPKGEPTAYWFEYGPTTAYGHATLSVDAGSGAGAVAATANLADLSPATIYHYRLVATNSGVTTSGADLTFTTVSLPTPASSQLPSPGATNALSTETATALAPAATRTFAGVKLVSTKLSFGGKFITLRLSCPTGTVGRCSGRTTLSARRPASGAAAAVILGRARFSMAAGTQSGVRVRVSRTGSQLLRGVRRLGGNASTAAHDEASASKTTVARVTILRRHR